METIFHIKTQQKNIREIKFYLSKCCANTTGKLEPTAKIMSSLCQKFANFHSIRKNFSIQQIFIPPTKGLPTTKFFFSHNHSIQTSFLAVVIATVSFFLLSFMYSPFTLILILTNIQYLWNVAINISKG